MSQGSSESLEQWGRVVETAQLALGANVTGHVLQEQAVPLIRDPQP